MNDVVKTLLEAQYIQNQTNYDYLLNQMKKIASETFVNIFSNVNQLANLIPINTPTITIQHQNQNGQNTSPFNDNIIYMNEDRTKQQTYQTTRRKMYSIDKFNKQQNNYNCNNGNTSNEIINNNQNNGTTKLYNNNNNYNYNKKIIDDLNLKANKLKKYNSGRNIVLRKNYINKYPNNFINYENNQKIYKTNNNETIENTNNTNNNEEEQENQNLFFQTGYPNETNKNPFKKINIKNINQNEILRINNNNFNNIKLNNKKEIIQKRIISNNTYKKKTFSPIKRIKRSYIVYTDSDHLYPETTANISNQNKKIDFNYNNNNDNEENEEEIEESSNEDAPLKVSQLKTEKRNFNYNKVINNEDNYDEEKVNENENEIMPNSETSETKDTLLNLRNKLGEKINEDNKKSTINKNQSYSKENINDNNEKNNNVNNNEKDIINKKKKITPNNKSLINLIHKYNTNTNKDKDNNNKQ
jgi:hypothetical protein